MKYSVRSEINYLMISLCLDLNFPPKFVTWVSNTIKASGFVSLAQDLHRICGEFHSWLEGYIDRSEIGLGSNVPIDLLIPQSKSLTTADDVIKIRQLCLFLSKASDSSSVISPQEKKKRFVEYEEADSKLPTSIPDDPLLAVGRMIISSIFSGQDTSTGRYGPGSVYGTDFVNRYNGDWTSNESYGRAFLHNHDHFVSSFSRLKSNTNVDYFTRIQKRRSEFLLVPKDIRGPRTICRERFESQYHQQKLRAYMEQSIRSSFAGSSVNFSDQSINADLALRSSRSKEFATIDLKDASDRISFSLVHRLFGESMIWNDMLESRSVYIDSDGASFKPNKWAPMGSAICFTTLSSVVFTLIKSMYTLLGIDAEVYVYGDDIIVPSRYAKAAIQLLEEYGLLVSEKKSFIYSNFRESCGMDAFDGVDVTPVKLRYIPTEASFRETSLASFCDTIHQLDAKGYYRTAGYLFALCKTYSGLKRGEGILPGSIAAPYLSAPGRYFDGLGLKGKQKYQSDLQSKQVVYRGFVVMDRKVRTAESETDAFYRVVAPGLVHGDPSEDVSYATDHKVVSVRDTALSIRRIITQD